MASLSVLVHHRLDHNEAVDRTKQLLGKVAPKLPNVTALTETWDKHIGSFSFAAGEHVVTGKVTVDKSEIRFESADFPLHLLPLKEHFRFQLRQQANALLAP